MDKEVTTAKFIILFEIETITDHDMGNFILETLITSSHKQPKTQNGGGTNDGGYIWVG